MTLPVSAEDRDLLVCRQQHTRLPGIDDAIQGLAQFLQVGYPLPQLGALPTQRLVHVGCGRIEQYPDLVERQTHVTVDKHPADAAEVRVGVLPVAPVTAPGRTHQTDCVPMMEGTYGYA